MVLLSMNDSKIKNFLFLLRFGQEMKISMFALSTVALTWRNFSLCSPWQKELLL